MDEKSKVEEVRCLIYLSLGASAYTSVAKVTAEMFACQVRMLHHISLCWSSVPTVRYFSQSRDENMTVLLDADLCLA